MAYPGLTKYTLAGLCLLYLPSGTCSPGKLMRNQNIHSPHNPPAQPCRSTQCRLHKICSNQRGLYLTMQWPKACPGLATHTLEGLCALWWRSGISSPEKLHKPGQPQPPICTSPALPQHPVKAPPHLLHTAEAAFHLAVAKTMPRAGHTHIDRAL